MDKYGAINDGVHQPPADVGFSRAGMNKSTRETPKGVFFNHQRLLGRLTGSPYTKKTAWIPLYAWAYLRSCKQYAVVKKSLGDIDPFRIQYRQQRKDIMGREQTLASLVGGFVEDTTVPVVHDSRSHREMPLRARELTWLRPQPQCFRRPGTRSHPNLVI